MCSTWTSATLYCRRQNHFGLFTWASIVRDVELNKSTLSEHSAQGKRCFTPTTTRIIGNCGIYSFLIPNSICSQGLSPRACLNPESHFFKRIVYSKEKLPERPRFVNTQPEGLTVFCIGGRARRNTSTPNPEALRSIPPTGFGIIGTDPSRGFQVEHSTAPNGEFALGAWNFYNTHWARKMGMLRVFIGICCVFIMFRVS